MDESLRTLERRLRAVPDDVDVQAEYRQALARTHPRPALQAHLDRVEGVLTWPRAVNLDWRAPDDAWVRSSSAWLPPDAPSGSWREAWRTAGAARWISSQAVLTQSPRGTLRGCDPRTGQSRWEVSSRRGLRSEEETLDTSVLLTRLGWAVAPWGAVEVVLRRELEWELERPSRDDDAERQDVALTEFSLELTVLTPEPTGWSTAQPAAQCFEAPPGELLGEVLPPLAAPDDDVLELALDESQPLIALRWRDSREDWAVWRYDAGALHPQPWAFGPDDVPFASTWRSEPQLLLRPAGDAVEVCGLPQADPGPRFPRELLAGRGLSPGVEGHKGSRVLVQAGWLYLALGDEELLALAPQ